VQIAFNSVNKIPGHVAPPPIDDCDNPTITGDFVTGNAPPPLPGDKQGATPPTTQPGGTGSGTGSGSGSGNGTSGPGGTGSGRSNSNVACPTTTTTKPKATTTTSTTTTPTTSTTTKKKKTTTTTNPCGPGGTANGLPGSNGQLGTGTGNNAEQTRADGPLTPPASREPLSVLLYVMAGVLFLLAVFGPPALAGFLKRRSAT
jgi:hypothetical protein